MITSFVTISINDAVIPHYASIHKELTSERRAKKQVIDKEIKNLDNIIKKADPLAKSRLVHILPQNEHSF